MKKFAKMNVILNNLKLPGLFIILCGIALILEMYGKDYLSGLGSNLLAEFIGAAVTVYGIDFLIRRREESRLMPVRASSYEDVRVMTHWALDIWRNAYVNSVGDSLPQNWTQLFSSESLLKVLTALDITKPANIIPAQPWSVYFDKEMERINKHAEKILERHAAALDPKIHNAVYTLVYYNHHKIVNLQALDRQMGTPRPTNLGSYVPVIKEWFEAVLDLHEWTISMHKYLTANDIKSIHAPYLFNPLEEKPHPPARFGDSELEFQITKYAEWQVQQSSGRRRETGQ